jgi:hypothetical protein
LDGGCYSNRLDSHPAIRFYPVGELKITSSVLTDLGFSSYFSDPEELSELE